MKEVQSLGEVRFGTLTRAAEGLTQWRPLLLGFLTLLSTAIVISLAQWLTFSAGGFLGLIMMLLAFVVLMAGASGVGIMLMDKAKNEPVRSFGAAASAGLMCLPRFLLFGVILLLGFLAYMVVAAVVYYLCKIPLVGGIIAFVAHPVLVLVAAAILIALIWVIGPLMAPALWSGLTLKAALANVVSIARARLVEVVLMEVVLYVILGLVSFMLFAGLMPATISLTGLAMGITGGANAMMGAAMGGYGGMGPMASMMGSGSGLGLMAGLGVLYCVVGAMLAQVMIMGMNLIYLQARESVDSSEAEGALDGLIGDVRKKAEEAKERTMAAAERAKQAAAQKMQERAQAKASTEAEAAGSATAAGVAGAAAIGGIVQTPASDTVNEQALDAQEAARAQAQVQAQAAEEAARRNAEADMARARAEAEAARLRDEQEAAQQQAARERAASEAAAHAEQEERLRAQAQAERQQTEAARQREEAAAARQLEEAQAASEQAEQARLKAQAEAEAAEKALQQAAAAATQCPSCQARVTKDDVFCGECGHKLK